MNAIGSGLRPDEAAPFEALAEQAQTMTVPPENLDEVTTLAPEDEYMTTERIDVQRRLRNGRQTILVFA